MSGPWHPTGRARVSARSPQAIGVCQRCGFWYQRRDLANQRQWQGTQLMPLNLWVCDRCLDRPQIQLKAIILPPDPVPVWMALPEPFSAEVPSNMITMAADAIFVTTGGTPLVMMSKITPTPNPSDPYLIPADF